MKNHKIELADFQDWLIDNEAVYCTSSNPRKQLAVTMNGNIKVYHNGEIVWMGIQPYMAVEKYNEI